MKKKERETSNSWQNDTFQEEETAVAVSRLKKKQKEKTNND